MNFQVVTKEPTIFAFSSYRSKITAALASCTRRRCSQRFAQNPPSRVESLESRTMLSESASAQITLVSTAGTVSTPVYNYAITVNDTGTTNIGTFWFGWVPGEDFLPSLPSAVSDPSGWGHTLTGSDNSTDGNAIEWVATSNKITPGNSLSGFTFSSTDSPSVLAANSPSHPGTPATTAFVYSGAAFSDAGFQFVVTPPASTTASTTTLATSDTNPTVGDSVTLTATVVSATGSGATPTGSVSFSQDGNVLGSANLQNDGTAALTTSTLPAGTDQIIGTYSGDSAYSTSASAPLTETVARSSSAVETTTSLVSSAPSATSGVSVTFTATVAPATSGAAPTGTVSFSENGTALGSSPLGSDGTASFSTSTLAVGSEPIVATYGGDSLYDGSASAPLTQTITAPPTIGAAIAKSTLPASIVSGAVAKGVVTVDIANETATSIKGKFTVEIFASTTGGIDSDSTLLTQNSKSLTITTAKSGVDGVSVKTPATVPAGAYQLFARVIDPASNAADSAAGPALTVAAPFVALTETVTKTSLPASAASNTKSKGSVILSIANGGNVTTTGQTTIALEATTTGVIDGSSVQLISSSLPLHIAPGKSGHATINLKTVPTIAAGSYTVVAQVTDSTGQISTATVGTITITA